MFDFSGCAAWVVGAIATALGIAVVAAACAVSLGIPCVVTGVIATSISAATHAGAQADENGITGADKKLHVLIDGFLIGGVSSATGDLAKNLAKDLIKSLVNTKSNRAALLKIIRSQLLKRYNISYEKANKAAIFILDAAVKGSVSLTTGAILRALNESGRK